LSNHLCFRIDDCRCNNRFDHIEKVRFRAKFFCVCKKKEIYPTGDETSNDDDDCLVFICIYSALTLNFRSAIHWYLEAKSQCIINENIVSFFFSFFSLSLFSVATAYVYNDKVASFLKMLNILFMPFSAHARLLSSSSSLRDTKG
jgi:hypothetical protein